MGGRRGLVRSIPDSQHRAGCLQGGLCDLGRPSWMVGISGHILGPFMAGQSHRAYKSLTLINVTLVSRTP